MATLDQLVALVRFNLSQLGAKNAQHEFEHLCRHYARLRVCANILPATGPVSAGGDQGRDFETFRSYLSELRTVSAFAGRVNAGPIAFACTLQKKQIGSKVRADVKAIRGGGLKPVDIHYFVEIDVEVAVRHKLQEWCRTEYGVELEIHDGNALAENLAAVDTFWIAERFLAVPSELFPRNELTRDKGYEDAREKWTGTSAEVDSYSQFAEIRSLLRHSKDTESVRNDLSFWIEKTEEFTSVQAPRHLRRRAIYEVSVARLRGLGVLTGYEHRVGQFLDGISECESIDELEDCVLLMSYCCTAQLMGQVELQLEQLSSWRQQLRNAIEAVLQKSTFASTKAMCIQLSGTLAFHPIDDSGMRVDPIAQLREWIKLADLLPDAPLFPIDQFSKMLTVFCPLVADQPDYRRLTDAVDSCLSIRVGGHAAARRCFERASAHHDAGRIIPAISEVHKSKINLFSYETLETCIAVLLFNSCLYQELGLAFAAKYHALAAGGICAQRESTKHRIWHALIQVANCDVQLGAFAGAIDFAFLAACLHQEYAQNPGDGESHPTLNTLLHNCRLMIRSSAERASKAVASLVRHRIVEIFGEETLSELDESISQTTTDDFCETLESHLLAPPASDFGAKRTTVWGALGNNWSVEWDNVYHCSVLAEQFIASLQIIQAELAQLELKLAETDVHILFNLSDMPEVVFEPILTAEAGFHWELKWPKSAISDGMQSTFTRVLATAAELVSAASFLSEKDTLAMIRKLFEEGIPAKAVIANSYSRLYSEVITEEMFNAGRNVGAVGFEDKFEWSVSHHPELKQKAGPAATYSVEQSERQIQERYDLTPSKLRITLPQLSDSAEFVETVATLRKRGWKDWHILLAIFNVVINARVREQMPDGVPSPMEFRDRTLRLASEGETDAMSKLPIELFSVEDLEQMLNMSVGSILQTWGFQPRHPAFTPDVVLDFLARRFRFWDDDVDHDDPF